MTQETGKTCQLENRSVGTQVRPAGEYTRDDAGQYYPGVSTTEVCCLPVDASEPWVAAYDQFDAAGNPVQDQFITHEDLEAWLQQHPSEFLRKTLKDEGDVLRCTVFKWDMVRAQYLHEVVRPETDRVQSLSDAKRKAAASNATLKYSEAAGRLGRQWGEFVQDYKGNGVGGAMTRSDLNFYRSFIDATLNLLGYANMDVSLSLHFEEANLYGLDIYLSKRDGESAEIIKAAQSGEGEGLLTGNRIIAVDGRKTAPMNQMDLRNAVRGPKGSTVMLTIRDEVTLETFKVPLARDRLPEHLR